MGPAAALIAASRATKRLPTQPALAELQELCEHNDHAPREHRVGRNKAIEMLTQLGFERCSHETLDRICREALNRKSWAQK